MIDFLKKNIKPLSLISIGVIIPFTRFNAAIFLYLVGIFLYTFFSNKNFKDKLDNFFLVTQAKLIGPKFRHKKLANTESLKEFDQKKFFTKKQLKAHWWGFFIFLCYPLVVLPYLIASYSEAGTHGLFIFFYLFSVITWSLLYFLTSTSCELKDCRAMRGGKSFIKINAIDKGITRRYSESSTNKDGLRTTDHYVERKFETTFQCNCCKRQFVTNRYVKQSA